MVDGSHNTLKCIHVQSLGPNLVVMWTISCDKAPSFLKQFSDEFVSGRKLSPCMACPLGHQDSPVFRRNFTMPHFQVLFLLKPYLHHLSILSFHCLSKSCIHLLHLIGVVIWQQINYCVHFPACFIESLLWLGTKNTSVGSSASPLCRVWLVHVNFSVYPCIYLKVNIDIIIVLISFFCRYVPFAPENYCWLHCLLSFCPDAKLECCLPLVQARSWLRNPNLIAPCNFIGLILIYTKGSGTWSTFSLFLGDHLPYVLSTIGLSCLLLLDCTTFLRSLWNCWIVSLPSLAAFFFLFVLLLSEMLYLRLNCWNQLLLALNLLASTFP